MIDSVVSARAYVVSRLILILASCLLLLASLSVVFLVFIPRSVDGVYQVIDEKVAEEDNAVLNSAKSISTGISEVATSFELGVDKHFIEIDELQRTEDKIIGRFTNHSQESVFHIEVAILVRDEEGGLENLIEKTAEGFGSLDPGESGHFYLEVPSLELAETDRIEGRVISAAKSFLRYNNRR